MGAWDDSANSGMRERVPGDVGVLVVDDQVAFRSLLRELVVATDGFVLVGEAASGEDALSAVEELAPQMVIMDKRMPGMGGIEATRVLTGRHPKIAVILISVEDPPDAQIVRSCGAAAFVQKERLSPAVLQEVWRSHAA
jgi:two-component system, NarL family, invasion response regulator UvrY